MQLNRLQPFAATLEKADEWINELMGELRTDDPDRTVRILRAVLHTLRDCLPRGECMHLSSHVPWLIRGMFFDGWNPEGVPVRIKSQQEFYDRVADLLLPGADPGPDFATVCVLRLLQHRIPPNEIEDICGILPEGVRNLFATPVMHNRL
jgi:uncharacterized protein (DUF2267 family)